MGDKIFIVVPAFNEEKKIVQVIRDLKSYGYNNIVVVDDGSKDNTYNAAFNQNVFVLQHLVNLGQGASLKTGIDFALSQGADVIVTFDSDGQHMAKDIPAMIKPVIDGKVDVALGSRFLKKSKIPFFRKIILKGSIVVIWLFYGIKLSDAHNGFRALSRKAAKAIKIRSNRMEHASEIIDEIKRKKLKFIEISVNIRYSKYSLQHGQGSFFGALRILFRMIFRKVVE